MIYILVFIISLLFLFIEHKKMIIIKSIKNKKINPKNAYIILLVMCFLICAFKADHIGIDTKSYLALYNSDEQYILGFLSKINPEYIFYLIIYIAKKLNLSFHMFLFVYYFLVFYFLNIFIKQNTDKKVISVIAFIAFGYLFIYMSALRQIMAISLCLLCFNSVFKNKKLNAILFWILAIGFHKSAFVCGVSFILFILKISKKQLLLGGILLIIGSFLIPTKVIENFGTLLGYESYMELIGQSSNFILILIQVIMNIGLLIYNYLRPGENNVETQQLFLLTIGTALYITSTNLLLISRIAYYFQIMIIVCYGNALYIYNEKYKINNLCFLVCLIIYFSISLNYDGLHTYHYESYITQKEGRNYYEEN